jgi:hypothetical protein
VVAALPRGRSGGLDCEEHGLDRVVASIEQGLPAGP